MRSLLVKATVLLVTTAICLVALEGAVRVLMDPVNFLRPAMETDPILRRRIAAGSGGHDEWGFRNPSVPESAQIVAIGDSQTYGNTAAAEFSWPAWLARISEQSVYNLGLGGYGPWEYLHLLRTKAPDLDPETIVVGFYFGNDLWDSFRSVYTIDHWAGYRDPALVDAFNSEETSLTTLPDLVEGGLEQGSGGKRIRAWFRSNSMLYGMLTVAFGDYLRPLEMRYLYRSNVGFTLVNDKDGGLLTSLQPVPRLRGLDLENARIREGLRLAKVALAEIAAECQRQGRKFLIVLIPTKVNVFADYAKEVGATSEIDAIEQLVTYENQALADLVAFLDERRIAHVNPFEELRARIGERLYPRTIDGHPSKEGYRVIAEVASKALP
jgi:hypothetical protein